MYTVKNISLYSKYITFAVVDADGEAIYTFSPANDSEEEVKKAEQKANAKANFLNLISC